MATSEILAAEINTVDSMARARSYPAWLSEVSIDFHKRAKPIKPAACEILKNNQFSAREETFFSI